MLRGFLAGISSGAAHAGGHIQGGILIRNAAERDLEGMHIEFHGLVGAHHATAVGEISYFRAIPESELEDERRDREARGRVTLQVQPMFGAIWLENPLEPGDLDATSIKGIGVRVGYGFKSLLCARGRDHGRGQRRCVLCR